MSNGTNMLQAHWAKGARVRGTQGTADGRLNVGFRRFELGQRTAFHVSARHVEDGDVLAYCTDLPGALAQGSSVADALRRLKEVVKAMVATFRESGHPIPWERVAPEPDDINLATIVVDG